MIFFITPIALEEFAVAELKVDVGTLEINSERCKLNAS